MSSAVFASTSFTGFIFPVPSRMIFFRSASLLDWISFELSGFIVTWNILPMASVGVVIVHAGPLGTALVKKDHCLMGRDFKALLTGLAGYIIIHSDEVIS